MPQYGEADYWEKRYTREPAAFDWYQGYQGLKYVLHQYLPLPGKLLHVGVGTSRLQEDMVKNGYQHIMNIDLSSVAIAHMSELHKNVPQLEYKVADVRKLPFEQGSYNGVIDKGTLDAILCGDTSVEFAHRMLRECDRVLGPGGVLVLVTYGDPASRLIYLEQPEYQWSVDVYCVTKPDSMENLGTFNERSNPVVKGPYSSTNVDMMESLSNLQNVHFIYVCRKISLEDKKNLRSVKTLKAAEAP